MSDSKIQIKVGIVEFSGEGDPKWLSEQLDKIIKQIPELLKIELDSPKNAINNSSAKDNSSNKNNTSIKPENLANWLKERAATSNQVRKFLATAAFLQLTGKNRVSTSEVAAALKQYNQGKLGNPSDCLAQNVGKGHCEKDGKLFYVRPEGFEELGVNN